MNTISNYVDIKYFLVTVNFIEMGCHKNCDYTTVSNNKFNKFSFFSQYMTITLSYSIQLSNNLSLKIVEREEKHFKKPNFHDFSLYLKYISLIMKAVW